ncbi:hypothetical protein PYW07_007913 [Mythimna separata]|uniref:C2H2-type domain-containing protein n=1 Tax=Mythimna separata TaxID=271217 RepID=A0AAD8DVC2_MYTSE|nr:hypothetical protein PYW07_007913 [Mythimna separata]
MILISSEKTTFTCGQCTMQYCNYKHLLEHLYVRHDIESVWCKQCSLKRCQYAVHDCHVLPICTKSYKTTTCLRKTLPTTQRRRPTTVIAGSSSRTADPQMIGCDGPYCLRQWFHFSCVGITTPPEGKK